KQAKMSLTGINQENISRNSPLCSGLNKVRIKKRESQNSKNYENVKTCESSGLALDTGRRRNRGVCQSAGEPNGRPLRLCICDGVLDPAESEGDVHRDPDDFTAVLLGSHCNRSDRSVYDRGCIEAGSLCSGDFRPPIGDVNNVVAGRSLLARI